MVPAIKTLEHIKMADNRINTNHQKFVEKPIVSKCVSENRNNPDLE